MPSDGSNTQLSAVRHAVTWRGTLGLLALALMAQAGWAQSIDPNGFFRLSSLGAPGLSMALESTGDYPPGDTRIVMLPTDPADIRQIWAIEQYGNRLVFTSALAGRSWALALDTNNFFLKLEPRDQTAADQNWNSVAFGSGFQIGNAATAGKALESSNELPRMDPAGNFSGQIWTFTRAFDIPDPPTVNNATLRIRNRFRGYYLYEDNGVVSTGALAEGDTRGHWEISKKTGTGYYDAKTYVLVNKATGHWLNMETGTLAASVAQPNWVSARWWLEPRETEPGQPSLIWWRISNAYEVRNTITLNTETSLMATSLLGRTGWHSAEWAFDLAPCTFTVTGAPTGALAAGGQSGSFTITPNSSACTWTAASSQPWLTVTPDSGAGTATVNWTAAANSTGATRTATITAGGQTFNVSQASTACTFTVTGAPTSALASGQSGTFTITTGSACAWTAASSQSWLTVTPGSGTGTAGVNWAAGPNGTGSTRTATITAGGQTSSVSQTSTACTFTVTGAPTSATAGGQSGTFTITPSGSLCGWTAASSESWLTVGPASGTGTATVSWTAAANSTGATRTATITAGGQTSSVSQTSTACTFTVTGAPTSAAAGGQSGAFTITASGSACAWAVSSSASWLTVTPGSGTGTGTVNWSAAANLTSAARTATITAAGQTFNVSQATACVATFANSGASLASPAAATGSVGFTLPSGCTNTPTSSDAWLTASITGATLTYSVTANTSITVRTATITLAGATFNVVQSGLSCSYALSPTSAGSTAAAGVGSVLVTAQVGCAWTAVASSASPWLRVEGAASGTGSGGFAYVADANPTSAPRTGTITVQGQIFTLTQQGGACVIVFGSSSASVGAAASNGTMTFSHPTGCSGTPVSSAPWLTVSFGAPFTLNYAVAANPSSIGRSATITLAGSTFTVSQSGAACSYTLTPGSRTVASAQNTGTVSISAPAGCVWAATADTGAPWLRVQGAPSGIGTSDLTYTVDANPGAAARTGVITVQSRTFSVIQNGSAQTMACAATSTPVALRRNGITELTADVLVNCTGVPSAGVMADLTLTMSRTVTSRVLDAAGLATEALLVLNDAASPVVGTSAWQAGLAGPNALRWKAVRIVPNGSGQAALRLTNLRVNTAPELGNVTALVEMRSATSIALTAPSVTVGTVADAVSVLRSGASAGPAANQSVLPVVFRELVANAFRTRSGAAGTVDRNTESGFFLTSGALTAGQADTPTRLHLKLSLPAGVRLLAPLTPDGSASARLVSADANGGGGSDVAATTPGYADITGSGGIVSATWEVRASAAVTVESLTFALIIQGATPAQLEAIGAGLTAGLAPLSTTPGAVLGAGIPRFAEAGRPVKLVNLRVVPTLVSTGVRALSGKSGARLAVSGNLAFNYDVFNDSSEASGTTVVRSSAPPGYSFSPGGTQAPDAAKIEFSGDGSEATLTYTGVAAGASTSLRMEVIPLMDPAPGELVENVVTVESRDLDIDLTNNRASAGVVSQSCGIGTSGANFAVAGGTGEFQISACAAWSVASSDSWVTITSPRTGTGVATVRYTVAPNPSAAARVTTIIAGGATFTITQSGTGSCALTASAPDLASPPAEGRRANITVTLSGGACAWTARSTAPWAEVFTTSGTTSTVISVTVYPNFGTLARSATVTVGDQAIAVTQPGMAGTDNLRFVRRTYFNVLRRLPSATEEAFHAGSLNSISRTQMMQNFLAGGEFKAGGVFVTGLYRVLLGRVPEKNGWTFQLNAVIALGIKQPDLCGNFLNAPEWLLKQGGTITNEAFVRLLFTEVLGRQPSAAELAFQLPNAANRSQMATNFLGIEEFYARNGALLNAIHAYFVILGRDPTTEELAGLEAQLRGGKTFAALVTEFVNSAEHNASLR